MTDEALTSEVSQALVGLVDVTPLREFEGWKEQLTSVDLTTGALYMRRFIRAYDWCMKISVDLHRHLERASDAAKHEEAKAKLERFPAYYKANKEQFGSLKDSAAIRDVYLELDEPYRLAREKANAIRAMVRLMDSKADSFRMAHDDCKKIYTAALESARLGGGNVGMPSAGNGGAGSTEE